MSARIFSSFSGTKTFSNFDNCARLLFVAALAMTFSHATCGQASAQQTGSQNRPGYYTDPATGIVYQQVTKTVERPVVETKMESKQETVYRPETVTETKPETQTVYTPVVEYKWEPRLHGRWNPFQQPTVAYHHVPTSRWEARNQVVNKTNTRTQWVAEKRTVEVPRQTVRMERQQKVEFQAVGQVAKPTPAAATNISSEVAARLRPLNNQTRVEALGSRSTGTMVASAPATLGRLQPAPRIAASTVGRMTSDPPRRNPGQGGIRATDLIPSSSRVRGQALPPSTGGVGIANLPSLPFMR